MILVLLLTAPCLFLTVSVNGQDTEKKADTKKEEPVKSSEAEPSGDSSPREEAKSQPESADNDRTDTKEGDAPFSTKLKDDDIVKHIDKSKELKATTTLYTNHKYNYEIRCPYNCIVLATGKEDEKDGRTIRIVMKETALPIPVLDIRVSPLMPEKEFNKMVKELRAYQEYLQSSEEVEIDGKKGRKVIIKWRSTGKLAMAMVWSEGVYFCYTANYYMPHEVWYGIIRSFHRLEPEEKSGPTPKKK